MNNYIKNLLATQGWRDVEKMFYKTIKELRNEDIDESLNPESYKATAIGNKKAVKHIEVLLNKINIAGSEKEPDKKISYK